MTLVLAAVTAALIIICGLMARRLGMAREEIRGLSERLDAETSQRVLDSDRITRAQDDMAKLLSDLNIRCAQNTAAIDHLPDVAQIIAAATGPLVDVQRPRVVDMGGAGQQTSSQQQTDADDVPDWDPAWDTYDPTDAEYPVPRMPDDYTPPQIPGVELPMWPS